MRIYAMDPNVTLEEAQEDPGTYFLPEDYCRRCYPNAVRDSGPEDEIEQDHPPYAETDYRCETCDRKLTNHDD